MISPEKNKQILRFLIFLTAEIYIFYLIISKIIHSGKPFSEIWLWVNPVIVIYLLDLYFLYQGVKQKPKEIDTRLSSVIIGFFGLFGFSITFFTIAMYDFPSIQTQFFITLKTVGACLSFIPYPIIILALLTLKKCCTIVPEAISVVKTGIYRYSRHPLYVAYIVWYFSYILIFPNPVIALICITNIIMLVLRYRREEEILLRNFPDYREYYKQTGLFPVPVFKK